MADLRGKVAVVTGGSRGVGKGVAEGLAEAGATVYVTGRSESFVDPPATRTIQATARRVGELGGKGIAVRVDHNDDDQVRALFERVGDEQGRLDLLVNNACKSPDPPARGGGFWEHPLSVWDDQCGVGLRGYYVAAVFAAPLMVGQGSGLIVNVSSSGATRYTFSTAYGVCKAGVDRMARDMAVELEAYGVSALSLWPGVVKTESVLDAVASGAADVDLSGAESPRFSGAHAPRSGGAQAPRFIGRCIAALAMDPDIAEKSGGSYRVAELAREYRFTDPDEVSPEDG